MQVEMPPHPRCGLPVARLSIDDERDEWVTTIEVCGEQLYLEGHTSEWIDNDGPTGPDYTVWKLTCVGGHVLMVPDDQGNEQEVPFRWDEAMKAVAHLLLIDGARRGPMPKYRKKPVVIEAIHYRGEEDKQLVREFVTTPIDEMGIGATDPNKGLHIETLEGWLHVSPGDWIIKGVKGEFYPCKPDIFEATYEPVGLVPLTELNDGDAS